MKSVPVFALLAGCLQLGPTPATTGVAAVPLGRPGGEAQLAVVPGFMLSDTTGVDRESGDPIGQLGALFEPDRLLGVPGLIVGARLFGPSGDTYLEPYAGYRTKLSELLALAFVAYGSAGSAQKELASYEAKRVGAELAVDARLVQFTNWLGLHAQATASATYVSAKGHYCVDAEGFGVDCSTDPGVSNTFVDGNAKGAYFATTGTLALDFGREPTGTFQAARLDILVGGGTMPTVENGMQHAAHAYYSIGFGLTVAFGAAE